MRCLLLCRGGGDDSGTSSDKDDRYRSKGESSGKGKDMSWLCNRGRNVEWKYLSRIASGMLGRWSSSHWW